MTKINKLLLRGFKSFANKTELVFGNDFNVVLGPNGSGKSNILDAITFVLGRSSSKAMRAEKSANLIYNGGKSKKPSNEAEVSISFSNEENEFPTPEKEIKITRIVKKNGQSTYKINDKKRTRQQVLDLMSMAKIDPEGYNIILQGDIVKFVDMSANDKRQVIEEIAGIGLYEEKKQKAVNELDRVEERIKEAEIILAERQTYLKELKKERDQAAQYKDLNTNLDRSKAAHLAKQTDRLKKKEDEQQKQVNEYRRGVETQQEKIDALKKQVEEKDQQIKDINSEIEEKGEVEQVRLNRDIEQTKIDLATNKTKVDSNRTEIEKVKERRKQLQISIKEVDEKIQNLETDKKTLEIDKKTSQENVAKIGDSIYRFKKKNKIDQDTEKIEKRIEQIDKEADEKQRLIPELRENQQRCIREKDRSEFRMQDLNERIERIADQEKENKDQIKELKAKRAEFKKTSEDLNDSLNDDSSVGAQLSNARIKLVRSQEELAKLNARNISIREKVGGGRAIQGILDQKKKIKGIYGTVSDLGQVNKKYAMALDVAAGSRIRSVVVEDDKVAQQCIQHLKQNQLGIATFLPLNKIRMKLIETHVYDLLKKPGVHGLAIDLVKFDDKYKNIFTHVFSNTLVIESIDIARKIGIGTTRMVTIEGDLVEISGAMIGGYRSKLHIIGGFKEEDVMRDIDEYEDVVGNLKNVIEKLEKKKLENEERINDLRLDKANLEGDVLTLEAKLHIEPGKEITDFREEKTRLADQVKTYDEKINQVQNKITTINKELMSLKIEKQQLRSKANELKNPMLLAELNAFEDKKVELREKIIRLDSEIRGIDTQVNNMLTSERENTQRIIRQHQKEEEQFHNEVSELSETIKKDEIELRDKEKKAKQFYIQFKELFKKRDKLQEETKKLERQADEHDIRIRGLEQKVGIVNVDKAKITAELAGIAKEFEQYTNVDMSSVKKSEEELRRDINKYERMLENVGSVNMKALEIYEQVETEYKHLLEKKETLSKEKEDVFVLIDEIETSKKEIFMKSFNAVNKNFRRIFSDLSTKGEAYLELEDPETVFEGGMVLRVKITGNRFMDLKSLSGGEKSLTALAFIFSVQEYEPASFYVLDEVDAALDKHNSEKLAKLISKYAANAQYVVISHNDAIISEGSTLYGISMNEHTISNVTSLKI